MSRYCILELNGQDAIRIRQQRASCDTMAMAVDLAMQIIQQPANPGCWRALIVEGFNGRNYPVRTVEAVYNDDGSIRQFNLNDDLVQAYANYGYPLSGQKV